MWNGHVMKNLDHLHVFGTECYIYIPKQFQKKFNKKRVCLVEWLSTWMIKMGTKFTCHLSTRLCTHMLSTSSQNEFASVQSLKGVGKCSCGRCGCGEKAWRWHNVRFVTVGVNPRGGEQWTVFQEHRTNNIHSKEGNVDDIRGLHSSISTHYYYWWWRSNVILGGY